MCTSDSWRGQGFNAVVQWRPVQRRVLATRLKNHKKGNMVETRCQVAEADNNLAGNVIENRLLHDVGVGCDRHAAGQNVIVYLHTAHVHGLFWRLSIPYDVLSVHVHDLHADLLSGVKLRICSAKGCCTPSWEK